MTDYHRYRGGISYRRYWLNRLLSQNHRLMRGIVVDLGGKRSLNTAQIVNPSDSEISLWLNLNINKESQPDIISDICFIPIASAAVDTVICTEVLEHLLNPQLCVDEAFRILKLRGVFIGSAPFIYPLHADPCDYSRFTAERIKLLFADFSRVDIFPMGGYLGTVGMLVQLGGSKLLWPRLLRLAAIRFGEFLCFLDEKGWGRLSSPDSFTTGFFWIAYK